MRIRFITRLLWLYLQFVYRTSSLQWIGKKHDEALRSRHAPYLIAFWHNRQAWLLYPYRRRKISILISPSRDGEIVSQLARCFGHGSVRGSSRKQPVAALRALIKAVREGWTLAITPDGPLGPAQEVKQGVVYLAQALKLPILPLSASSSRRIGFNSWDRFLFPLPFSRVVLVCGEPIYVTKEDDLQVKACELKSSLDRISEEADHVADRL